MKADMRRGHILGRYEWRLEPDHVECLDRRGYREIFDRVFYDEIETVLVFRQADPGLFLRGLLRAAVGGAALLTLRAAFSAWTPVGLIEAGYFGLCLLVLAFLSFVRGRTIVVLKALPGTREIVFNARRRVGRAFVARLLAAIRFAQARA
jgi:hypothetical protein